MCELDSECPSIDLPRHGGPSASGAADRRGRGPAGFWPNVSDPTKKSSTTPSPVSY